MTTVKWLTTAEDVQSIRTDWIDLENRVKDRTVFSTFAWSIAWYGNYCVGSTTPFVGTAWEGDELVGIAPLVKWKGTLAGIPVNRIDFAGHNSEAGEFLIQDEQPEIIGSLLRSLEKHKDFDFICLNHQEPGSAKYEALSEAAKNNGYKTELLKNNFVVVDISEGFDKYFMNTLSGKFRRNLKSRTNKMEALGGWKIDRIRDNEKGRLDEYLDRVIGISNASWKAKEGGPMADHHRKFYKEVAGNFAQKGMLDISILSIGGEDAAYIFAITENGVYYDCTISFSDKFRQLSPGTFIMIEMLKHLPADGYHTVVSHGDHEYKRYWASRYVPQYRVFLFSKRIRSHLTRYAKFRLLPFIHRMTTKRDSE